MCVYHNSVTFDIFTIHFHIVDSLLFSNSKHYNNV